MTDSQILITGATGAVGRHVVSGLLEAGDRPRVLTRDPARAGLPAGLDVRRGDLEDPRSLAEAFDGVRRLYLFPAGDLPRVLTGARTAGVEHVVLLSSASVLHHQHAPDHSSRHHQAAERAVIDSGIEHTLLRPAAFMSNDLMWAPEIAATGRVSTAYPDAASAPIDERDIAAVAVAALTDPTRMPAALELTGPESLSQRVRVETLARALDRPLELVELTDTQAREQMSRYLPPEAVELIVGILAASPATATTAPAPSDLTGRDPNTYLDWAKRQLELGLLS